jgi:uncharacterized protein (DUF697 family)
MQIVTPLQVYLITRLDNLGTAVALLFGFWIIFAIVMLAFGLALRADNHDQSADHKAGVRCHQKLRWIIPVTIAVGILRALMPSTQDAVLIWGLPAIVNNETVQKKAVDAADGTADLLRLAKDFVADKLKSDKEATKQ